MNDLVMKVASIYAPADGKERASFFASIASMIDSSTVLSGDFNCVDDPSLDTQRSSQLAYANEGADVLKELVEKHNLRDEIREQIGVVFEFTHSQKTPTGGFCLSRIDRQYLPDFVKCQWTSTISDRIDESDHAIVTSKATFLDESSYTKGNDLFTINPQVINIPDTRKLLIDEINKTVKAHKKNSSQVQATIGTFKYKIRAILKKATRQNAKKINDDIANIDHLLSLLHMNQTRKPSAEGAATRTRLIEERIELKKKLSAPKPNSSYFVYKKSELMSRQFWQTTFPRTSNTFKGIMKLCKVRDWNHPPPKNIDTGEYSDSVPNEAANYYSHLYTKPPTSSAEKHASEKLFSLLENGNGVDYSTSKAA
eukprot:1030137-Pleurochrysis_carterae.AAC.1